MGSDISLVSVSLVTICLESCLYGIFLVLLILSAYLLAHKPTSDSGVHKARSTLHRTIRNPFMMSSFLLAFSITAHWLLACIRLVMAFVTFQEGTEPLAFYEDLSQRTEVAQTAFIILSLLVGDAMIIYRLWIVWGYNNYIVIFPICALVGLTICGVGITVQFSLYKQGQSIFLTAAGRWINADSIFVLLTNIYSNAAIAWKIWSTNRSARQFGSKGMTSLIGILIESAAIQTVWGLFFVASYQARSNLQSISIDCLPAITGIAYTLITVRVGLGWTQATTIQSAPVSQALQFSDPLGAKERPISGADNHALHSLATHTIQRAGSDYDSLDFPTVKSNRSRELQAV